MLFIVLNIFRHTGSNVLTASAKGRSTTATDSSNGTYYSAQMRAKLMITFIALFIVVSEAYS